MIRMIVPFIGLRYLRPQREQAFTFIVALFSFFGMILGVATLIVVMSVMNGFREELFSKILGVNGHIAISDIRPEPSYDVLINKLENIEDVVMASPIIYGQVLASTDAHSTGALVRGVSADDFSRRPFLKESLVAGQITNFEGTNVVILGQSLARNLNVTVGNRVQLISPEGSISPFGIIPRNKSYQIVGISDVGMDKYDSSSIYMPMEAAQLFFKMPNRISEIDILATDPNALDKIKSEIGEVLFSHGQPYAFITDWRQKHESFYHVLQVEQSVMFIILFLIILVAAFNIISSMIMLVRSKFKDIAILRTMGASRKTILQIFLFTGSFIGVLGIAFGAMLGLLISYNISTIFETLKSWVHHITGITLFDAQFYYLSTLPAIVDNRETIQILCIAFILTIASAVFPAWRAATLDPVKAVRNE